jgi:hypothetical protein
MLERAIELDTFGATHFGWIDFGIAHVAAPGGQPFDDPSDRVRLHQLRDFGPVPADFWRQIQQYVAGGYFVGEKGNMSRLAAEFWVWVEEALSLGYCPLEQDVMGWMALLAPESFSFSRGGYSEILSKHSEGK